MSTKSPRPDRRTLGPLKGSWNVPPTEELQEVLAPDPRVDVFETVTGEATWRFIALNGQIVADSTETFGSREAAARAAAAFVAVGPTAPVGISGDGAGAPAFVVYRTSPGEWRWSLRAANGQILAASAEGYASEQACEHAVRRVRTLMSGVRP